MNDVRKHTLLFLACIPFLYECNPSGQKAPVLEYETVFEEMLETVTIVDDDQFGTLQDKYRPVLTMLGKHENLSPAPVLKGDAKSLRYYFMGLDKDFVISYGENGGADTLYMGHLADIAGALEDYEDHESLAEGIPGRRSKRSDCGDAGPAIRIESKRAVLAAPVVLHRGIQPLSSAGTSAMPGYRVARRCLDG